MLFVKYPHGDAPDEDIAKMEPEKLGCSAHKVEPLNVHIPGNNGTAGGRHVISIWHSSLFTLEL